MLEYHIQNSSASEKATSPAIILIHGYGSHADDLFSFAKRVSVNGEFGKDDKFITMPGEFTSDEEEEIED